MLGGKKNLESREKREERSATRVRARKNGNVSLDHCPITAIISPRNRLIVIYEPCFLHFSFSPRLRNIFPEIFL